MTKISIRNDEFRQPIAGAIAQGKKVVIWHQIPWYGGMQEWFLIRSIAALDKILSRGCVASAFTAYDWIEIPASRTVNQDWLEQTSLALKQETRNLMLLIEPVVPDKKDEPTLLTWIGELDDIQEYFKQHTGLEASVGRIPFVLTGEIIRGYYPDDNGVPQSGAY